MNSFLQRTLDQSPLATWAPLFGELMRYGVVAAAALAVDAGSLAILKEVFSFHYLWAGAIGFLLGLVTNYALSVRWVFNRRSTASKSTEFLVFATIGLIGLLLTQVILWLGTDVIREHYMVSKAAAVGIVFFVNFGARKILLFK